jgi:hypothetical protein
MDFRQTITLHVDESVGGVVGADKLLEGWQGLASISATYGTLSSSISFFREIDLTNLDRLWLTLNPRDGTWNRSHAWGWHAETTRSGIRREGEASSLAEAIAAVDAVVAEIKTLTPA